MNSLLSITREPFKNCPAGGIGKCLENVICYGRHGRTIAKWLLIVKLAWRVFPRKFSSLLKGAEKSARPISVT
jgi:hypothetical protein